MNDGLMLAAMLLDQAYFREIGLRPPTLKVFGRFARPVPCRAVRDRARQAQLTYDDDRCPECGR